MPQQPRTSSQKTPKPRAPSSTMTKPTPKRKKKLLTSFPISKDALRQSKYRTDIQRLRFPHGICGGDILGAAKSCSGKVKFFHVGFKKLPSGIPLKCLYGKMKQEGRMGAYSQFRGKAKVLYSTDVASRGLDYNQAVDWVVHVDCPEDVANHKHRVGQTARCQSEGQSLLIATPSETKLLEELDAAKKPIDCIKANVKKLQPVSGVLSALPVKYPDTLPGDEFSASMRLPLSPRICFSNQKMKSKKPLELSPLVEPGSEMENALKTPMLTTRKKENSRKNSMDLPHGTTILWVQISPTKVLVGVDSQSTIQYVANDPANGRSIEFIRSRCEEKFIRVFKQVYATISGDKNRSLKMIDDLKKQIWRHVMKTKEALPVEDIGWKASKWFTDNPRNRERECPSTIVICGWTGQRYELKIVGDDYKMPVPLRTRVFGCGSGCVLGVEALRKLTYLKAPIDVTVLAKEMKKAVCTDPHTGGQLQVFSLENGEEGVREYVGTLLDDLYNRNPDYTNLLFNGKSMFVIVRYSDRRILGPTDLQRHVERFDPQILRESILWLCFPINFVVYLVMLASPECCSKWFNSCRVWMNPIGMTEYTNSDYESCDYCLTHANSEMLDRARRMESFDSLADPPTWYLD